MTWADTIGMAFHNLWCRRGRSALNLLGVVVGCCMLLMTDAGVRGVRQGMTTLFESSDFVRQIQIRRDRMAGLVVPDDVLVVKGEMDEVRRKRIQEHLRISWLRDHQRGQWGMAIEELNDLELLPHVVQLAPLNSIQASVTVGGESILAEIKACPRSPEVMERQIVEGTAVLTNSDDEILIDDVLAWKMGFRDDASLHSLVGSEVQVLVRREQSGLFNLSSLIPAGLPFGVSDFRRQIQAVAAVSKLIEEIDSTSLTDAQKQLVRDLAKSLPVANAETTESPGAFIEKTFRICGVYVADGESGLTELFQIYRAGLYGGFLVSPKVGSELFSESRENARVWGAMVTIDDYRHLDDVTTQLQSRGLVCVSALRIMERVEDAIDQAGLVISGIAAVILVTTCIGICNTLFVSILQRTPEFGIMKSVGAEDRHVRRLMLCEGAVLGTAGGVISIAISMLIAVFGGWILKMYVEGRVRQSVPGNLFQFSATTALVVVAISVLLCIAASVIPAIRASRMDPIIAMRRL